MRAAVVREWGAPESVTIEELADPEPGPGEVVVRVESAAVNYPDVLIAANQYQVSISPPFTPGSEWAGVVERTGPGVTARVVGDRVERRRHRRCVRPEGPRAGHGGADPRRCLLRHRGRVLRRVRHRVLRPPIGRRRATREWVAVLGAAGGVGLATVDLALLLGARVLAAASSPEKVAVCRERGAEAVVDYDREPLKELMKEVTGGGADVVVDPVGGTYAEEALRATHYGSRFITVGYAAGIPRIPLNLVLLKGVRVLGYEARTFGINAPQLLAHDRAELQQLYESARVAPYIGATFDLDDVAAALRLMGDRGAIGKIIIHPWSEGGH